MSYKLSDKQKEKIIALAKQGYSNDKIARMAGCHEWSVWKIRKNANSQNHKSEHGRRRGMQDGALDMRMLSWLSGMPERADAEGKLRNADDNGRLGKSLQIHQPPND